MNGTSRLVLYKTGGVNTRRILNGFGLGPEELPDSSVVLLVSGWPGCRVDWHVDPGGVHEGAQRSFRPVC